MSKESEEWDESSVESEDEQDSLCTILAEENGRNRDWETQTEPSSGTYNLNHYNMNGREEQEMIALSRKIFRGLLCSSNVRTNLEPESDREVLSRMVCVKPKDDIHNPEKLNGQMMALKGHVKARYRLLD